MSGAWAPGAWRAGAWAGTAWAEDEEESLEAAGTGEETYLHQRLAFMRQLRAQKQREDEELAALMAMLLDEEW